MNAAVRIASTYGGGARPASLLWTGLPPAAAALCVEAFVAGWGTCFTFEGAADELLAAGVVEPAQLVIERKGRTQTFADSFGCWVQTTRQREPGKFRIVRRHYPHVAPHPILGAASVVERPTLQLVVDNTR